MDHSPTTERRVVSRVLFAALALIVVILFAMFIGVIRMAHRRSALVEAAHHLVTSYQPFVYSPPRSVDLQGDSLSRQLEKNLSHGPPSPSYFVRGKRPFWAGWVANVFDNDPFAEVEVVAIHDERFCDADVSALLQISSLCKLDLSRTGITDEGVALVAKNSKLVKLDFYGTQISDRCLPMLDKLLELRELDIANTNVTKDAVLSDSASSLPRL